MDFCRKAAKGVCSERRAGLVRPQVTRGSRWIPLVDSTDSPLLWLTGQGVPDGKVAHINEDGTVLITDNAAGSARAIRQAEEGSHGWPPPCRWPLSYHPSTQSKSAAK
jgi:hypothetical protein